MTTLVQDVIALLKTLAPAGGIWYQINTTQPPTYPYIAIQRVVNTSNVSLSGPSDLQNTRFQFDIYSRSVSESMSIEVALEALLAASTITNVPLTSQDFYDDVVKVFRVSKDYSLWARN